MFDTPELCMRAGFVFSDASNLACSWIPLAISLFASAAIFMPAMRSELKAALAALVATCRSLVHRFRDHRLGCFGCLSHRGVVAPQPQSTCSDPPRRSSVHWISTVPWRPERPQHAHRSSSARKKSEFPQQELVGEFVSTLESTRVTITSLLGVETGGYDGSVQVRCHTDFTILSYVAL